MLSYESMRLLQEMPKTGGRYKIIVQCSAVQFQRCELGRRPSEVERGLVRGKGLRFARPASHHHPNGDFTVLVVGVRCSPCTRCKVDLLELPEDAGATA